MKWEYKVEPIPLDGAEAVHAYLHAAGMLGWELVTVLPEVDDPFKHSYGRTALVVFKREVASPKT